MLTVVVVVCLGLVSACSWHEKICSSGQYPAKLVGSTSGSVCVTEGQDPPSGYVRYPAGQEPKYVGDHWDEYWKTKVLDEHGNIVSE